MMPLRPLGSSRSNAQRPTPTGLGFWVVAIVSFLTAQFTLAQPDPNTLAVGEAQKLAALESMAGAIRAETCLIGLANVYIVTNQSKLSARL